MYILFDLMRPDHIFLYFFCKYLKMVDKWTLRRVSTGVQVEAPLQEPGVASSVLIQTPRRAETHPGRETCVRWDLLTHTHLHPKTIRIHCHPFSGGLLSCPPKLTLCLIFGINILCVMRRFWQRWRAVWGFEFSPNEEEDGTEPGREGPWWGIFYIQLLPSYSYFFWVDYVIHLFFNVYYTVYSPL